MYTPIGTIHTNGNPAFSLSTPLSHRRRRGRLASGQTLRFLPDPGDPDPPKRSGLIWQPCPALPALPSLPPSSPHPPTQSWNAYLRQSGPIWFSISWKSLSLRLISLSSDEPSLASSSSSSSSSVASVVVVVVVVVELCRDRTRVATCPARANSDQKKKKTSSDSHT